MTMGPHDKRLKWLVDKWPSLCPLVSSSRFSLLVFTISVILLSSLPESAVGEVLTPPYFNLAQGRRIYASATCGEAVDGQPEKEMYCNLVGSTTDTDDYASHVVHGHFCDMCEKGAEGRSHPAEYAIDGSERRWQSPPLSRGIKYSEVNLTIDLGQEFHIAYVNIRMANSPRPGVWVLERSSDNGQTYHPWQYFAENPKECERFFSHFIPDNARHNLTADDAVVCDTTQSKIVPLENGEIFIRLLEGRPSAHNFFASEIIQEWTRATHVRFRFIRHKTLLGHLMSVSRQDTSVTRRYFYAVKGIEIGGRCRCNGHADICPPTAEDPDKLLCSCQHNTDGPNCENCKAGYAQKAWRPSTHSLPFACEACNCHGHADLMDCDYNATVDAEHLSLDLAGNYDGGGVCKNCRHNTEGINCNKCTDGFYKPRGKSWDEIDVCQPCRCHYHYSTGNCAEGTGRCECSPAFLSPNCDACNLGYYDYPDCKPCDCHFNGTRGSVCEVGGGQCPCKHNYADKNCDRCADGYYNFPDCHPCECEVLGSVSPVCDLENGQCECQNNFGGRQCGECDNGYYDFPACVYCKCDFQGTLEERCDKRSGACLCKDGYGGPRCDQCLQGYYGYPDCKPCNCSSKGSSSITVCDATGKCPCLENFSGRACDQCKPGYYQHPECLPCGCNEDGSMGVSCDDEGKCQCKPSFDELRCDQCREGYYNFPLCEDCNCDPAGVTDPEKGCGDSPPGELCVCKDHVEGRICNVCKPLYWNLQEWNPQGCEECDCHGPGIVGGVRVCESKSGQCPCKNNVGERRCTGCRDGYYNLTSSSIFGCEDCGCDVGGSVNAVCDKDTGQCPCRSRITGQHCKSPLQTHYFPTLFQFQYEAEDGSTASGGAVRFGYDEDAFPDYSWRGYAVYSQLQPETFHEVIMEKPSLYLIVLRYLNPGTETVVGEFKATPDNPSDEMQSYKVRFEPKAGYVTVSIGNIPTPFVLNPGRWQFSIKSEQYLYVDYFVLLPGQYYEGNVLSQTVHVPCMMNTTSRSRHNTNTIIIPDTCVKYKYPSIDKFDTISGAQGFVLTGSGDRADMTKFYSEKRVLDTLDLDVDKMGVLSTQQPEVHYDMDINKSGRYALLLEYFTPQGANLTEVMVETKSTKGDSSGQALIHNCKYAFLCRQVVTTPNGEVAVFKFSSGAISVVLKGPTEDENGETTGLDKIALKSITAVPFPRWSLDHITPQEFCIVKNGSCIPAGYELPPDYVKVEAESGDPVAIAPKESMPEGVEGKNLVLLDSQRRVVDISGKVPFPGYYTILVHYYQPDNPEFSVNVLVQNGQHYPAKVPLVHCPSTSGCRAQVSQEDKNNKFYMQDHFVIEISIDDAGHDDITLKSPKNVWIDYVLLMPSQGDPELERLQLENYLNPSPLDETRRFFSECGKKHFYLPTDNVTQFCRDAAFSITTDYNDGALPCQCDYYGSTAFECEEFGGQCPCKEYVIGRRCERCKTGYFGFPNCKPCDCPSTALCDEGNGACICPPRVVGDKCDTCAPLTYGFDSLIGCEDCNCHQLGVENGDLQCDLQNGHCRCKTNVVGRTCDKCKPGFWAFPYCQMCDCDIRGTTEEICNQDTSGCHCKSNVEGRSCEQCKPGSFNLQEKNPHGCSSCFCFGKTTRCTTSYLFWTQISFGKFHWNAIALDPHSHSREGLHKTSYQIEFEDNDISGEDESTFIPIYVPEDSVKEQTENYILYFRTKVESNHLASMGGRIMYNLISEPNDNGDRETFGGPEVILEGHELSPSSGIIRLLHYSVDHLDGDNMMRMNLELSEENFVVASHSIGGSLMQATRDQLMIVLKGLKSIYVRAGYWKKSRELKLSHFALEIATEDYNYTSPEDRANTVEQCHCPPNYQGLSCEECAPGYYRSPSGPFGGFCVPCQCNGHSDLCDPVSGVCIDCKHNTTGNHCEMCEEGFHGDAKGGSPYDCLICACPIPTAANNFATQCEVSPDGREISCTCKDGYIGPRCEGCGPGFYGRPEVHGDYCKSCNCSGNIDPADPSSCDTVTGACLKCMNNTGGPACNLCAAGYYGDALFVKNCRQCACNTCGTYECDNRNGECECRHNVEGYLCDRCKADHYGLSRCDGLGCQYCDCSIASYSTQCDDMTGQCECKKGTTGRRCERCAPGYYNYTEDGCQECECNTEYAIGVGCDPETGQCSCLPGVVGERCDRCPWRWVLIEDRGCQGCDSCQHKLLDVTDALAAELDPVKEEFDSVAVSYFTTQKLTYFNDTVAKLRPNVQLMDPSKADLSKYYDATRNLENDAATQRQKAEIIEDSLEKKAKQSEKLRQKSYEVESKVQEAVAKATTTVFETKDLMEGLLKEERPSSSPQTDAAKAEAEAIVASMQTVQFDPEPALEENATISTVLKDVKKFVQPLDAMSKDLKAVSERIAETRAKLSDLRNQSDHSITTARKSNEIGNKIKDAKFPNKLGFLEGKATDMLENTALASDLNAQTPELLESLRGSFVDLGKSVQSVPRERDRLEERLDVLKDELKKNENTVAESHGHARKLKYEADNLDKILSRTKAYAENAVAAATAYETIESSLTESISEADKAVADAQNATSVINGLDEIAQGATEPARNLLRLAESSKTQVEVDLKMPLRDAKSTINQIEAANNITDYSLANFDKELKKLSGPRDTRDLDSSVRTSNSATKKAETVQNDVDKILENLPNYSDRTKRLRVSVSDINSGTGISESQLHQAKDSVPLSNAIIGNLEEQKPAFDDRRTDIADKLADLKAQIAAAREQANRVPVGMNLQDSSSLLLANPHSLESQQAQTKVSFYFKTQEDGLIFYLGNEPGKKEEDFMSVEVDRGYPVLMIDLGSGPQRIMNEKYVADNQWYKATIDRSGKTVRFIIAQDDQRTGKVEETVKEDYLSGSKSLFNVDRNSSKLFVGGLPPGVVRSPVRYSTYRGAIEDLMIGDEKVGLWNFKDAENIAPANERDKFIDLQAETGLRFLGNGYAILDRKAFPMRERSGVSFRFKTRAKNGLMFLVGKGRKYMAIFMSNGNVVFQYDLGNGPAILRTTSMYNDGQWHNVDSVRHRQRSQLTVDSERVDGESPGSQWNLAVGDYMYWGGYPGEHGYSDVSSKGFDGCLEQVNIDGATVDLTHAVESRYTSVGCSSSQFAPSVATFFGQGYVMSSSADTPTSGPVVMTKDDSFEANFRMRSNASDGLILYGTDSDQSNYVSVSMKEGSLYVKTEPGGRTIRTDPLNDANWHVVTITRDKDKLVVNVDDDHEYVENAPATPVQLTTPGSILLFGGKPEDYDMREGAAESHSSYSGCLADISINGNRLDFSESQVQDSNIGQKCVTAQEKEAMALEIEAPKAHGRTISDDDEGDDDDGSGPIHAVPTPRTTTTTTTLRYREPEFESAEREDPKRPDELDEEVTPTPFMSCKLPYKESPKRDVSESTSMEDGVMFGNLNKNSRYEYYQQRVDGTRSDYQIDFKTSQGDGLIFMWTIFEKPDYIALFMKKGVLHFAFDSGAGPAYLDSGVAYNDSKWHTASVSRHEQSGLLIIDGETKATGVSAGSTTEVNAGNIIYVGGLPPEGWARKSTSRKLLGVDNPFKGCLRNFMIRGNAPTTPSLKYSVQPCADQVEPGLFFFADTGYLKLSDTFNVGRHIKLSMSIKPRHPSGLLVAVHGDRDFMVLQLVNGTVKFTVDSGKGVLSSSYKKEIYDLCDGNWHTIQVTYSKNVVTLALDNLHSSPGIGQAKKTTTNTNGPLYVGGHPNPSEVRGIETTDKFVGCMRDFIIENRQYKMNHDAIVGNVGLYACPTD